MGVPSTGAIVGNFNRRMCFGFTLDVIVAAMFGGVAVVMSVGMAVAMVTNAGNKAMVVTFVSGQKVQGVTAQRNRAINRKHCPSRQLASDGVHGRDRVKV